MTIKEIFERYAKAQEGQDKLRSDIEALQAKQAEEMAAAESAAERGDVEAYKAHKAKADDAGTACKVREIQLRKSSNPITVDEARTAWEEICRPLNKNVEKLEREYIQARADLFNKFMALIKANEQTVTEREDLARITCPEYIGDGKLEEIFPAVRTSAAELADDRKFFLQKNLLPHSLEEIERIGRALYRHTGTRFC